MSVLPHGKLRCTSSNGTEQFFVDGKYISKKNIELIRKIAQREYYEQLVPVLENKIHKLQMIESEYNAQVLEKCFEEQCNARKKLVVPVIETIDMKLKQFIEEKYEPGQFEEHDKTEFYTINGERVRSKSEMIIANELNRYNIPYHYEMPIMLQEFGKMVTRRPDFIIMNPSTGKQYIYEHFGMMDYPAYVEHNMRKINLYERNGYVIGKNFVFTHETSKVPLNIGVVDTYIENFFV